MNTQKNPWPRWKKFIVYASLGILALIIIGAVIGSNDPVIQAKIKHDDSLAHIKHFKEDSIKQVAEKADEAYNKALEQNAKEEEKLHELELMCPDAFEMSHEFVERRLKAPGSAKYPAYNNEMSTVYRDSTFLVISYVDAQNSFGALLRNHYECKLKYAGNGKWKLIELNMEDK